MNYEDILKLLEHNKDFKYKIFNDKIVNTKMNTIGVRVPVLRKISKKIAKTDYEAFLNQVKNSFDVICKIGNNVRRYGNF